MLTTQQLIEGEPKNPSTIILKNVFYPKGLNEENIYNYYISVKRKIIEEVKNREVMFFIKTDNKDPIVKRKNKGSFIKLTSSNYNELIHGRTLSIHSTMKEREKIGIVDIDTDNFLKARTATAEIYDYLIQSSKFKKIDIKYTGKESFHLVCHFHSAKPILKIKELLAGFLKHKVSNKYDLNKTRNKEKINLDLSSNKYRGGFITPYSLSVWGLKCIFVDRKEVKKFDRRRVII